MSVFHRLKCGYKLLLLDLIPQFTGILVKKFLLFSREVVLSILPQIHMSSTLVHLKSTLYSQTAHFTSLSMMLTRSLFFEPFFDIFDLE